MIADTSFLIDVMASNPSALRKARELENSGSPISVGAPTIFELFVGIALSKKSGEEKSRVVSTVASLPQLPLDFSSSSEGGVIYAKKLWAGSRIDPEDAMLAGIAKRQGEAILTRNTKHFSGIEGVRVETY